MYVTKHEKVKVDNLTQSEKNCLVKLKKFYGKERFKSSPLFSCHALCISILQTWLKLYFSVKFNHFDTQRFIHRTNHIIAHTGVIGSCTRSMICGGNNVISGKYLQEPSPFFLRTCKSFRIKTCAVLHSKKDRIVNYW